MNNNPIGIIDSGIGGLSVERVIRKQLPHESIIYIGDTLNTPYGEKSPLEILDLAKAMIDFLRSRNAKIIVIACNTITVSCIDLLREAYPELPIIGTVPVVKMAAERTKKKKIGIFSTQRTAESVYQKNLIAKFADGIEVINIGSNEIVPFIERGEIDSHKLQELLKKTLWPFQEAGVDVVALGCTHYPFIEKQIQDILGKEVVLLESNEAITRQVERVLNHNDARAFGEHPTYQYFITGSIEKFQYFAKEVLQENIPVHKVSLAISDTIRME